MRWHGSTPNCQVQTLLRAELRRSCPIFPFAGMVMPSLAPENYCEILGVEDNPGDVFLIRRAMKKQSMISLATAGDGREAIELLRKRVSEGAKLPDLILLDLAMPRMDGHEFLAEIKRDKSFPILPVVVFSSSSDKRDVAKSYQLGAVAYVAKPSDLSGFTTHCDLIAHMALKRRA